METNAYTFTKNYAELGKIMEIVKEAFANLTIPNYALHSLKDLVIELIVPTVTKLKQAI